MGGGWMSARSVLTAKHSGRWWPDPCGKSRTPPAPMQPATPRSSLAGGSAKCTCRMYRLTMLGRVVPLYSRSTTGRALLHDLRVGHGRIAAWIARAMGCAAPHPSPPHTHSSSCTLRLFSGLGSVVQAWVPGG